MKNILGTVDLTGLKVNKINFIKAINGFHIELSNGDIYEERFSPDTRFTSRSIELYTELTTRFPAPHINAHSKIN